MADTALLAERLGFDHVWVHDYIDWSADANRTHISCGSVEAVQQAPTTPPYFMESITNLACLAGVTTRIKLGFSVLILPWRHPVITARQLANIDFLSRGRLLLGVGAGANRSSGANDFEVLGLQRTGRFERTAEYLRAILEAWEPGVRDFNGDSVSYQNLSLFPKPVQHPVPILIGGSGARSVDMVIEFDGTWMPGFTSPEMFASRSSQFEARAKELGVSDFTPKFMATCPSSIDLSDTVAHDNARRTLEQMAASFSSAGSMERVANSVLVGSPERIRERIESYAMAGVSAFELRFIYRDISHLHDQLALFQQHVMV